MVYVQPEADDTPVDDGQGDSAGRDVGGAGEDAHTDKVAITVAVTEAAATDVAEALRESEIPHQTEV
jgi:hypothetical protein